MKRIFRSPGLIALGWLIASCGGAGDVAGPPPPPTVATVTIAPPSGTLVPAATAQLVATARDASGQQLHRNFLWNTSDPARATVSSSGTVTGVGPGTATITASVDGKSGSVAVTVLDGGVVSSTGATLNVESGVVQIVVPADAVTASTMLSVAPSTAVAADPRVVKGAAFDFGPSGINFAKPVGLTIKYDPANLPSGTEEAALEIYLSTGSGWQVVAGSIVDAAGKTVTTQVSHFSTYAILTPEAIAAIVITGPSENPIVGGAASLLVGVTQQLTAALTAADGRVLSNRHVSWATSDPTIASVTPIGFVAALKPGLANITASAEGKASSVAITVTPIPVATVSVSPTSASVVTGSTQQLTATLRDANSVVLSDRAITWTSDAPAIGTVDATTGLVTAVALGTATITATTEGKSGSATVTVTPVPVATVTVSPATASLVQGSTQQLTVETRDAGNNVLTGRVSTWQSDHPEIATVSSTGVVTAVSVGSAAITATSEGKTGISSIVVTAVPVASVTVSLTASSVQAGQTTQATAVTRDASGSVLTGRTIAWSSDNIAVATVTGDGVATAVAPGTAQITATSETKSGAATITVIPVPVATVAVSPLSASVLVGGTHQFAAVVRDAANNVLTGRAVAWSSDLPTVASVNVNGLVIAHAAGSATITATTEGKSGTSSITVSEIPVATVTVALASASVIAGETTQATATTLDANNNVLAGRAVTWSSGNTGVATVSSTGVVTTLAAGTARITATSEGKSGNALLTVTPVPVASVSVSLAASSITVGQTAQATATVRAANNDVLTGRAVTWSSSNTAAATVSSDGLVTAVAPGTADITATSEGQSGSATITVTPVPVATVTVSPPSANLIEGTTQQLTAETRDANSNVLTGRVVEWSSGNTAIATVSSTGLVIAISVGTATITATSEGKDGLSSITVTPVPVASVSVSLAASSITVGATTQATATTYDASSNVLTGRVVAWSSDNTSVAIVSNDGVVTAVAPGTAAITATSEGKSGSAPIFVTPVPVASVVVSPATASVVVGATEQLSAETRDAGDNVLTGRLVAWSSSDETVASVDANGLVTAHSLGPATITATSEGKSGTSSITVTPVPVATVTVALTPASVTAVETSQATATTLDASGGVLTGRTITWSSDNTAVATVSSEGLVTAIAVGTAQITATSEEKTGSATITVTQAPVATVSVALAASSINAVETTQASATLHDSKDRVLTGRVITWSSDNTAVATVSSEGLVTAVAVGTAQITATSEEQTGSAAVTVTPAPVATVTVSPASADVAEGSSQQLTATLKDAQNRVLDRPVTWSSSNVGVATVSSTGLVSAVWPGSATITAMSEGVSGTSSITVPAPTTTASLLRRSSQNPRYFENATGQVVYLTGSHTWSYLRDNGTSDPPAAFNYAQYLSFLESRNHNFFRLWAWEQDNWTAEFANDYWFSPGPYQRSGPGSALDGKPKFDLTQFNQGYFDRLRQRVIAAGSRGIYVSVMLFDGWSVATKGGFDANNPWKGHPFNAANNINGIDGDTNGDGLGLESHTLTNSAVTARQEAYVRKVIDAVGDLDNVLYEISNESDPSSKDWQYHMIQFIRGYEATKPKQHPVGMTPMWPDGADADLLASSADWISITGSLANPITADGSKVIISDTDHLCGVCGSVEWVWKSFTKGQNPILMDGYDGAAIGLGAEGYNASDPVWEAIRNNLGYARSYALRMDLSAAVPHGDKVLLINSQLVQTGYSLAKLGSQYLVFIPGGGSVTLDLTEVTGSLNVEWFNPATGATTSAEMVTGGPSRTLTAPFGGDAVLFLF